jgi:hypothetical protein
MAVRWDAVVRDDRFWSEPARPAPLAPIARGADSGAMVLVQVSLFGSLAGAIDERPLALELQTPFAVDDVIAELGRRFGAAFLAKVTTPDGERVRHCRVYLDGEEIEDTAAPVRTRNARAQMEMIMLTAAEGG